MEEGDQISPFSSLPKDCIAKILSLTSPKDACRAAAVSKRFKPAAESDTVWEWFLPRDYCEMISQSDSPVIYLTKKDLYFLLFGTGLLFDGGNLIGKFDESSGKKCYMLCARKLQIAWIDDRRYWTWTSLPESRFSEVAELIEVWWFDIFGSLPSELLSPDTAYTAYLVFKLANSHVGFVGFPFNARINCVGESMENDFKIAYTVPPGENLVGTDAVVSNSRGDGWMELELGNFL